MFPFMFKANNLLPNTQASLPKAVLALNPQAPAAPSPGSGWPKGWETEKPFEVGEGCEDRNTGEGSAYVLGARLDHCCQHLRNSDPLPSPPGSSFESASCPARCAQAACWSGDVTCMEGSMCRDCLPLSRGHEHQQGWGYSQTAGRTGRAVPALAAVVLVPGNWGGTTGSALFRW